MVNKKLLVIGPAKPGVSTNMLLDETRRNFSVDYVSVNDIVLELNDEPKLFYGKKDLSEY